jgi:LysR family hca operon transcriptional activator
VWFRPGHLEYFVVVAEERQITRAAKRLCVAQPALSHAIADLESEVGVKLLNRHARGVTLTEAGESFLERARVAAAAERDALETASSLARHRAGIIEFGFLGAPPGLDSPTPLLAFVDRHPAIDLRYRELPFPSAPTSSWLSEVDVAVCHLPAVDDRVWARPLRREARHHPLAGRTQLTVEEVIGETFVGFHPTVEPTWAGFWSLDDHRGRTPMDVTADRATNPQEVLAALAVRCAVTTVPASVARIVVSVLPSVVAIPLQGADPCTIVLLGHEQRSNRLVSNLVEFARAWGTIDGSEEPQRLVTGSTRQKSDLLADPQSVREA